MKEKLLENVRKIEVFDKRKQAELLKTILFIELDSKKFGEEILYQYNLCQYFQNNSSNSDVLWVFIQFLKKLIITMKKKRFLAQKVKENSLKYLLSAINEGKKSLALDFALRRRVCFLLKNFNFFYKF